MTIQVKVFLLSLSIFFVGQVRPVDEKIEPCVATVCVPVADLRAQDPETKAVIPFVLPEGAHDKSIFFADNKFQESQLLFGETVRVIAQNGEWVLVDTLEQKSYSSKNLLVPCQGWVNKNFIVKNDKPLRRNLVVISLWAPVLVKSEKEEQKFNVSFGTRFSGYQKKDGSWDVQLPAGVGNIDDKCVQKLVKRTESIKDMRADMIERAKLFLNSPYIWGGASSPMSFYPEPLPDNMKHQVGGVDCSGLVYIVVKSLGLLCPRNSNDQYLFSSKISSGNKIKPGDLIFFAKVAEDKKTPLRVTHVAIYAGSDENDNSLLIESQGVNAPYGVRIVQSSKYDRLGNKRIRDLNSGDIYEYFDERNNTTNINCIFFGSFFSRPKMIEMRKAFLSIN